MRSLIASGWHADGVPVRSIVDAGAEVFAVPLGAGWSRNVTMPRQVVSVAGFHDQEAQGRPCCETCRRVAAANSFQPGYISSPAASFWT